MIAVLIIGIYILCLLLIFIYCLAEMYLARQYNGFKKQPTTPPPLLPLNLPDDEYPMVTVQLPVYNEMYVIERLIDAVAAFDYPVNRFEIQVLDDSSDETTRLAAHKIKQYQTQGLNICHIRRTKRTGFKAGALQDAMPLAKGELIAIFDADFIPTPDFLRKTVPYFKNPCLGMVQTRWEFVNKQYSILTLIQSFFIDAHFTVEQGGRNASGYFMNFNGTAGIWRKQAIIDGGGWQHDTLTEDLDLSYRTQLKGWQFYYLDTLGTPSELPADMPSFKSQQFRWIKGGAETAAKNLPAVLRSNLSAAIKMQALVHLLSGSIYIVMLIFTLISVPLLLLSKQLLPFLANVKVLGALFMLSNVAVLYVHYISAKHTNNNARTPWKQIVVLMPPFLVVTIGLSLHNALAALRGWHGQKTPFIRTPKFSLSGSTDKWQNKRYTIKSINKVTLAEGVLSLYFLAAMAYAFASGIFYLLPMHLLAFCGFATVFTYSVLHTRAANK